MPAINIIDCKYKRSIKSFLFAASIFSKSSTIDNFAIFENVNILQMWLKKTNAQWLNRLTLWWGDLKITNHMLGIQGQEVGINWPHDWYKHLFSGLALWHLWFNYLKMIWELFYLGESSTEYFTLQWAANHVHWDKTTKPTDFYLLKKLIIYSYKAQIIAILKSWI